MRGAQGTRRYGSEEAEPIDWIVSPSDNASPGHMTTPGLSEMFAYHATTMANTIKTSLIVFSRKARAHPTGICPRSSLTPHAHHPMPAVPYLCASPASPQQLHLNKAWAMFRIQYITIL